MPPPDDFEAARRAIAARRERFVKAALTSAGLAVVATGCDPHGSVCHAMRRNAPSAAKAVGCSIPGPCLSIAHPCLAVPMNFDAGPASADAEAASADADVDSEDGGSK